jgi:H+/gluconate symporter-like permease
MLSSFIVPVTICFAVGIVIVMTLAARARGDGGIARVLYDVEHPEKTRWPGRQ